MAERKIHPKFNVYETYRSVNLVNAYIQTPEEPVGNPNLLSQPNNFTDAVWSKSGVTITDTTLPSYKSTNDASQINVASSSLGLYQLAILNIVAGNSYTLSVYLKSLSGTTTVIIGFNGRTKAANNKGTVLSVTNTWQKYTFTAIAAANDTGIFAAVSSTSWAGANNNNGIPAFTIQISDAKLENGSIAT